jgi:hypothetical protein
MLVTGESVTAEHAFDIILCTDTFFSDACSYGGGNNHRFNEHYRESANLTAIQEEVSTEDGRKFISVNWDRQYALRKELGFIETGYVSNDWGSSSFIFGPHGWCHPDGTIKFIDNVGKWPSIREVYDDWVKIAEAWPFLDLHVTLMDGESGMNVEDDDRSSPVINFRVQNGKVDICAPDVSVHGENSARNFTNFTFQFDNYFREQGVPLDWYNRAAGIIRVAIENLSEDVEDETEV